MPTNFGSCSLTLIRGAVSGPCTVLLKAPEQGPNMRQRTTFEQPLVGHPYVVGDLRLSSGLTIDKTMSEMGKKPLVKCDSTVTTITGAI
uniref:Uncharacterized protein n=1 Tax=Ascaris lumbricoides TaxID=6252 RepID=A0A0M3I0C9_ASCLU